MNICVLAGMIDAKLHSKIAPLQAMAQIDQIYLLRRKPYSGPKIQCSSPPKTLLKWMPVAELWRLILLIYVLLVKKPELIVAFGTIPHGIYAAVLGRLLGIPVVQHVMGKNDLRLTFNDPIGRSLAFRAVKSGSLIAVRGKRMKRWLEARGISSPKIFIPQNLHDFTTFKPAENTRAPQYDLIYVGLLERYKRVDTLIDIIKDLHDAGRPCTLIIVGDGSQRPLLEEQSRRYGLENRIHFQGEVAFEKLPQFYRLAKAFIMTSQGEGLPMAMIEALSCGLPVIVPADADIEEVARDGENGVTIQNNQKEAYAKAIARICSDTDFYHHLKAGAIDFRNKYCTEYSLAYQVHLWHDNISNIIPHMDRI